MGERVGKPKEEVPAIPAEVEEPKPDPAQASDNLVQMGLNCIKNGAIAEYRVTREKKARKIFDEIMDVISKHQPEPDTAALVLTAVRTELERAILAQIGLNR